MHDKKVSKKMIVIPLVILCAATVLILCYINIHWWKIRSAGEIKSIDVRLGLDNGYKDITITDSAEIEYIRNMAADIQDEFNIFGAKIRDAEYFQSDAHICLLFNYSDGRKQEFWVQKNSAVGFMGQDYYWKYIRMDNVNTNELYDYFQEDLI